MAERLHTRRTVARTDAVLVSRSAAPSARRAADAAPAASHHEAARAEGPTPRLGEATATQSSVEDTLLEPGRPLEPDARTLAERRLGFDFGRVRIHADSTAAAASARELDADAYNVGEQVVFARGRYKPHTQEGRSLLFHELAHVTQRQPGAARPVEPLVLGSTDTAQERHAERVAHGADRIAEARSHPASASLPAHVIARRRARDRTDIPVLPQPTVYDSSHETWILEQFHKGRTQFGVSIHPNVDESLGRTAAGRVVADLNAALRDVGSAVHFVVVTRAGPDTVHIGSSLYGYDKRTTDDYGLSGGPRPGSNPFIVVPPRQDTRTGPEFALERSTDGYMNTLMHELLHHLGLGHAYTWVRGPKGWTSTYDIDGRRTQMVGDVSTPTPKDLRDRQYLGVPAADRAELKRLYGPQRGRRAR